MSLRLACVCASEYCCSSSYRRGFESVCWRWHSLLPVASRITMDAQLYCAYEYCNYFTRRPKGSKAIGDHVGARIVQLFRQEGIQGKLGQVHVRNGKWTGLLYEQRVGDCVS
jgi:hypothetical protein